MAKATEHTIDLSIIIPALNEAEIIEDTLLQLHKYITNELPEIDTEVIVVAAHDKDNTAELAENMAKYFKKDRLVVVSPKKRVGKGRDVALGFKHARGRIQIFTDADLAIPLTYIKPTYEILNAQAAVGNDVAVFGIRTQRHTNTLRKVISYLGNLVTRLLFLTRVSDLQCGFKGFTSRASDIGFKNLHSSGWMFDVEVFAKLQNHQITIIGLPITNWRKDTHHLKGENLIKTSFMSLIDMINVKLKTFSLKVTLSKIKNFWR